MRITLALLIPLLAYQSAEARAPQSVDPDTALYLVRKIGLDPADFKPWTDEEVRAAITPEFQARLEQAASRHTSDTALSDKLTETIRNNPSLVSDALFLLETESVERFNRRDYRFVRDLNEDGILDVTDLFLYWIGKTFEQTQLLASSLANHLSRHAPGTSYAQALQDLSDRIEAEKAIAATPQNTITVSLGNLDWTSMHKTLKDREGQGEGREGMGLFSQLLTQIYLNQRLRITYPFAEILRLRYQRQLSSTQPIHFLSLPTYSNGVLPQPLTSIRTSIDAIVSNKPAKGKTSGGSSESDKTFEVFKNEVQKSFLDKFSVSASSYWDWVQSKWTVTSSIEQVIAAVRSFTPDDQSNDKTDLMFRQFAPNELLGVVKYSGYVLTPVDALLDEQDLVAWVNDSFTPPLYADDTVLNPTGFVPPIDALTFTEAKEFWQKHLAAWVQSRERQAPSPDSYPALIDLWQRFEREFGENDVSTSTALADFKDLYGSVYNDYQDDDFHQQLHAIVDPYMQALSEKNRVHEEAAETHFEGKWDDLGAKIEKLETNEEISPQERAKQQEKLDALQLALDKEEEAWKTARGWVDPEIAITAYAYTYKRFPDAAFGESEVKRLISQTDDIHAVLGAIDLLKSESSALKARLDVTKDGKLNEEDRALSVRFSAARISIVPRSTESTRSK